jgi:hypothetical protein
MLPDNILAFIRVYKLVYPSSDGPGFETSVFPLAMEKTSISKPLDVGAQADGEYVLQRRVDEHVLLPPMHY